MSLHMVIKLDGRTQRRWKLSHQVRLHRFSVARATVLPQEVKLGVLAPRSHRRPGGDERQETLFRSECPGEDNLAGPSALEERNRARCIDGIVEDRVGLVGQSEYLLGHRAR